LEGESEDASDAEGRLLAVPETQKDDEAVAEAEGRSVAVPHAVAVGVREAVEEGVGGAAVGVPSMVALTEGVTVGEALPVNTTVRVLTEEAEAVPVLPPPPPLSEGVPPPEADTLLEAPPP